MTGNMQFFRFLYFDGAGIKCVQNTISVLGYNFIALIYFNNSGGVIC